RRLWRPTKALTTGDRLLLFWSYQAFRGHDVGAWLLRQAPVADEPLIRLAFPDDCVRTDAAAPSWAAWTAAPATHMLEALEEPLAECLVQAEERKEKLKNARRLRIIGRHQYDTLDGYLQAMREAGRTDLAGVLLQALARVLVTGWDVRRTRAHLDVS